MTAETECIKFGEREINYFINRTSRKTVGITVDPDGKVIVKAPTSLDDAIIKDVVYNKRKWIVDKLKLTEQIKRPIPLKQELVSGEKLLFKNQLIRLKIHNYSKKKAQLSYAFKTLHIYVNENLTKVQKDEEVKKIIIKWYREKTFSIISNRIEQFLKLLDFKPKFIKIRDQKMRWGSCTKDGKLFFNWRIAMAPISAIDYIIVHELCHLKNPTHSDSYWNLVESLFPQYKKWKEWLRKNGRILDLRV